MKKIVTVTALTGGLIDTRASRQAKVDAAVARCVSPIGPEEAANWDAIAAQRAKAA